MKNIWFCIIIVFICMTNIIYANIDAQIYAIKHASAKERFKLMNKFKRDIVKMKKEERIKAMIQLSKKSNNKDAKKVLVEFKRNYIRRQIEHNRIDDDSIIGQETSQEGEEAND